MTRRHWRRAITATLAGLLIAAPWLAALRWGSPAQPRPPKPGAVEVRFWHFWGGADRDVVDSVVRRFNASQDRYHVRSIAMPGNNLDLKLFLAVTGGSPPDLVNQDDPILGDWVARGAAVPLADVAGAEATAALQQWLYPTARRLGTVDGQAYAVCNGLDLRALYYNDDLLRQADLPPPTTLAQLDDLAQRLTRRDADGRLIRVGFLPDPRRWWAWGTVFGETWRDDAGRLRLDGPRAVAALRWMDAYRQRLGTRRVLAFRQSDQSLPGKSFPLLSGRYAAMMDGQWRVRDIAAYNAAQRQRGETPTRFGVVPLPPPPQGRQRAGWLNGNFFLIPTGARRPEGAWQFIQFWIGFDGQAAQAARTCAAGGWIPVAPEVAQHPHYQRYLADHPLMNTFIDLAASEAQQPYPLIPGAALLRRTVEGAGSAVMSGQASPQEAAAEAQRRIAAPRPVVSGG